MRYATWDLAFVAVLAFVGPSRQPSRSSRMSRHGDGGLARGWPWLLVGVRIWMDLAGFLEDFVPAKLAAFVSVDYMSWTGVRSTVCLFFQIWGKRKNDPLTTANGWRSCKNFSQSLKSRFSNELNFSKPPRTVPGCSRYKSNCFLAILRFCDLFFEGMELLKTWPFSLVTWWPEGMKRSRLESPGDV